MRPTALESAASDADDGGCTVNDPVGDTTIETLGGAATWWSTKLVQAQTWWWWHNVPKSGPIILYLYAF